MAEVNPPAYQAGQCYTAQQDRSLWDSIICAEGVCDRAAGDLAVTATTGMGISIAAGCAWIQGDTVQDQGIYSVTNNAAVTRTLTAADPVDTRLDLVIARVYDAQYAGATNVWAIEVLAGTPSPAPVQPALPANAIRLALVTVAGGATSITQSNISDQRVQYELCAAGQPAQGLVGILRYTANASFAKASYPGLRAVRVITVGGGGGGGATGTTGTGQNAVAGGGGGGGYSERYVLASSLGASVAVTVGAGGAGGAAGSGAPGGTGGTSSFGGFCSAAGGAGAAYATAFTGNDTIWGGGPGGNPGAGDFGMVGEDGEGGRVINGFPFPSNGGASGHGFGAGATTPLASIALAGRPGDPYGGGGGGAFMRASTSTIAGGAGGDGVVIVYLYN